MPPINSTLRKFSPYIFCLVIGALASLALPPAHHVWVYFIGISGFWLLLETARNKRAAFALAWLFGFGFFTAGLYWIGNAMLVEGNAYAWAWPLAVSGLPAVLAIFTGLAGLADHVYCRHLHIALRYAGFVILLSASEWLRGHLFTGFPWNLPGSIWADHLEMLQILWPGDIYWLSLLTLLWAGLPGLIWSARKKPKPAAPILMIGLITAIMTYGYGLYRLQTLALPPIENFRAHIIQPNIPQNEKWDAAKMAGNFRKLIALSAPPENTNAENAQEITHIIIWPETAISQNFLDDARVKSEISAMLRRYNGRATLLTGALRYDKEREHYFNSLISINAAGAIENIYDKFHLVPFGEYIPFQQYIPIPTISGFSGFERGSGPQTQSLSVSPHISYSPLVCYEILFPGKVINAAQRPDFIVNVTNDGWYGDSAGPHQHLAQARFRAIEEGMSALRAANTGISAIISPLGDIEYHTPLFEDAVISQRVVQKIPQKIWSNHIPFIGFIALHLIFFGVILRSSPKKQRL